MTSADVLVSTFTPATSAPTVAPLSVDVSFTRTTGLLNKQVFVDKLVRYTSPPRLPRPEPDSLCCRARVLLCMILILTFEYKIVLYCPTVHSI